MQYFHTICILCFFCIVAITNTNGFIKSFHAPKIHASSSSAAEIASSADFMMKNPTNRRKSSIYSSSDSISNNNSDNNDDNNQKEEEDEDEDFGFDFEIVAPKSTSTTSKSTETVSSSTPWYKKKSLFAIGSVIMGSILAVYQHNASPASGLGLLRLMEQESIPMSQVTCSSKPTVIEFYADWCDICKKNAATVRAIEFKYRDQVNFVTLNAIKPQNDEWVQRFQVDGIPHFAFFNDEHRYETALVGGVPQNILEQEIHALATHYPVLPYLGSSGSNSDNKDIAEALIPKNTQLCTKN